MDGNNGNQVQTNASWNAKRHKSSPVEDEQIELPGRMKKLQHLRGSPATEELLLKKAKKAVGRFFYESGLDYNAVNLPSFQSMISFCSASMKQQVPTPLELKGWIFYDAVKEMHEYVNGIRSSWAETGCSILIDEWTDEQNRNLVNILVDCPKGTIYLKSADVSDYIGSTSSMNLFFDKVLTEVGLDNVVQIMACSTSMFMKEVGRELMERYRPIFWTFSSSCCIDLMLEKLCRINLIKETLEKAKTITRFVYANPNALKFFQERSDVDLVKPSEIPSMQPFLTLETMAVQKEILKAMFQSPASNSLALTSTLEGKQVADLVANRTFWNDATNVLKGAIPLVRVIELMNKKQREQMGYIYETIDQVKETIKEEFNSKKSQYTQFWNVVDEVWNDFLYSPIHSAGYFLNPNLFYTEDVYIDPEVATGLFCCIVRSTRDTNVQDQIVIQLEKYRMAKGSFSIGCADDVKSDISPAHWWSIYGGDCPELQRLAFRILSQTCDGASKFQLKRSLAEALLSKEGSENDQKRLSDKVFLQYNMHLQNFSTGKADYIALGTSNTTCDWIENKPQISNAKCLELVRAGTE